MIGKLTILGSGTSQGVPVIACDCEVCQSYNLKDKRTRTSVLININGENHVVDSGPDFRTQMLLLLFLTHRHSFLFSPKN